MKPYRLVEAVQRDLNEIWEYIARESVDDANRILDEFDADCTRLAAFPGLGKIRTDFTDKPFRFWPFYSYFIIYRLETQPLEIVRVLSGYRNIADLSV